MDQDMMAVDHVMVRGRRLDLSSHVHPKLFDREYVNGLRRDLREARPFAHLVVDDWFNPVLLELVAEEFDMLDESNWKLIRGDHELTRRSVAHSRLGPASEIYFGIVNSGWFIDLLSEVTGIEDLLPDPKLFGGGLHETPTGGAFGVHRDFDVHIRNGLANKMVFLTYLNKDWDPAWGSALELWDVNPPVCAKVIQPQFGTSVLMVHGPASFHGHPTPMTAPAGKTRRSVATYYYHNPHGVQQRFRRVTSVFLFAHRSKRLRHVFGRLMPPILVDAIRKFVSR